MPNQKFMVMSHTIYLNAISFLFSVESWENPHLYAVPWPLPMYDHEDEPLDDMQPDSTNLDRHHAIFFID